MNRASQKNLLFVVFGIILVVLLLWFVKLFRDTKDAKNTYDKEVASNKSSQNINVIVPTPSIILTPTPLTSPTRLEMNNNATNIATEVTNKNINEPSTPKKIYEPTPTPKKPLDAKALVLKSFIPNGDCPSGYYLIQTNDYSFIHIIKLSSSNIDIKDITYTTDDNNEYYENGTATIIARITGGTRHKWYIDGSRKSLDTIGANDKTIDISLYVALGKNNEWAGRGMFFSPSGTRLPYSCDEVEKLIGN